jgi:hypothetical protein
LTPRYSASGSGRQLASGSPMTPSRKDASRQRAHSTPVLPELNDRQQSVASPLRKAVPGSSRRDDLASSASTPEAPRRVVSGSKRRLPPDESIAAQNSKRASYGPPSDEPPGGETLCRSASHGSVLSSRGASPAGPRSETPLEAAPSTTAEDHLARLLARSQNAFVAVDELQLDIEAFRNTLRAAMSGGSSDRDKIMREACPNVSTCPAHSRQTNTEPFISSRADLHRASSAVSWV